MLRAGRYVVVAYALFLTQSAASAGEPERLTRDGLVKREPTFWPGRDEIVYSVEQPSGRMKLARLNLKSGASELLHSDNRLSDREITFSADGKTYAYNSITGEKGINSEVVITDTMANKSVSAPGRRGYSQWPCLSPDAKSILYAQRGSDLAVWQIDFAALPEPPRDKDKEKKKEETPIPGLTKLLKDVYWPRFSPDGKQIVLSSPRDGNFELYVMDADGQNLKRLTDSAGMDTSPAFSPDGKQIAFTSNRDGNHEIYVMQADGSGVRRVTSHDERDEDPTWTPDGKQLVIVSERDGQFDLYRVDVPAP